MQCTAKIGSMELIYGWAFHPWDHISVQKCLLTGGKKVAFEWDGTLTYCSGHYGEVTYRRHLLAVQDSSESVSKILLPCCKDWTSITFMYCTKCFKILPFLGGGRGIKLASYNKHNFNKNKFILNFKIHKLHCFHLYKLPVLCSRNLHNLKRKS